jgi:Kdo2-lipid IVA lauroyltransferase/acyltransferase
VSPPPATPRVGGRPVRRVTLAHRLEIVLVALAGLAIRLLPERWTQAMGAGAGWVAGVLLRIRYRVVLENLRRAFPEASPRWIRKTAASVYRHVGREGITLLRMASLGQSEVRARSDLIGLDALQERLGAGKGVLVLAGHFGNWEIGGAILAAHGVPLDVVARRQANPLFDARLRRTRERLGVGVLARESGIAPILNALRANRAIALAADQNVQHGGVFVDFFGVPASTARGPATLARRTGAGCVVASVLRLEGPQARYQMRLTPLDYPEVEGREAGDRAFLRSYLALLEDDIRQDPAQYLWPHRRWKTRPPPPSEEPVPPGAGTRTEPVQWPLPDALPPGGFGP